ncbi:MAG: nitrate/nitrite transporter [Hyphomicrobiaceae bacterium]
MLRNAAAKSDDTSWATSHARVIVLVLLPFVSGYYLSYLYRSINALISEALVAEFALSPGNLGFLTATYFLAFAVIQLPLGCCLDRFGPRRVQAVLLSIAAAGAALFAYADSFVTLAIARGLIGLGVAGALMAGLKAIVLWFPAERIALANGWFIMLGALGAVTATAPAEIVLAHVGWRGVFAVLAAVTAASALLILLAVPERRQSSDANRETGGLNIIAIYRDSRFWRLAPLSASCIGSAWALQGLWAAPWLADVEGFERPTVVAYLFVMALALSASALLLGIGANRLRRNGISLSQTLSVATGIALVAQLALVLRWPVPAWLPWIAIAAVGAGTVLSYAILSEMFPRAASGRANGALNLLHVTAAFAVQYAIGLVIQLWPAEGGHYPEDAYQMALGVNLALQVAAFLWFVRPKRKTALQHLSAHPIHALASSLGLAPAAALSYARARHGWSLHMAGARAQQQAWRTTAFASFAVSVLLALSVMSTVLSGSVTAGMVASAHAVETRDFADAPPQLPRRFETLDHRPEVVAASLPLGHLRSLLKGASHGDH